VAARYDHQLRDEFTSLRFLVGPHGALFLGPVGKTHGCSPPPPTNSAIEGEPYGAARKPAINTPPAWPLTTGKETTMITHDQRCALGVMIVNVTFNVADVRACVACSRTGSRQPPVRSCTRTVVCTRSAGEL
jgi:hypothetical protein